MLSVFYSHATRDTAMFGMVKHSKNDALKAQVNAAVRDVNNYAFVVSFCEDARDLEDVWEAMQAECSSVPRELRQRSMMVGDLVLTDAGEVYVVDSCGFERLDGIDVSALQAIVAMYGDDDAVRSVKKAVAASPVALADRWY